MSSSTLLAASPSAAQPTLMIPDDLIDPTRAAALRFSRFPVVDAAARSLAVAIVDQYITRAWLDKLTLNRDMPRAVLTALAHASRQLEERSLSIPWHSVLLVDLPTVLGNHYAAFAGARAAVAVSSSSVLHQPPPAPKVGTGEIGGLKGRRGKQPGVPSQATQVSGCPSSATSHSSISSDRQAPALQFPFYPSRSHVPPQLTAQSGSSASLAPTALPSTPTQPQAPRPPPVPSPDSAPPGWPTASTPVDQFTPTDAKFSLLMPHVALEPGPDPSATVSPNSPPSATLPGFNDYLRTVANVLLDAFLPASTLEAEAERVLMREIVAGVLGMVIEAMADPVMLLRAITAAFEAGSQQSLAPSQEPLSSSAAPTIHPQQSSTTPTRMQTTILHNQNRRHHLTSNIRTHKSPSLHTS
ncbi:PXA domain-domain-containing protein [Catenaria anguillulae PL171]|uniref:PXA domain-domain-containing protein n=1 Tax=Catenaria anguillulae PL171 TaxID=765915 RepID=A0A1Y2I1J9_9FUNG|nr:PXA domain-domain-containing protein [Catenaria anguillulae PL171]